MKSSSLVHETTCNNFQERDKNESFHRLSKRLTYLLRYGACKEGLQVDDNGYVNLDDLLTVHLLHKHSRDEVLEAVRTSLSYRKTHRYEWRERDGQIYIRAAYLRNFEKNPYHYGTKVKTLFETSTSYILSHLDDFDLEEFPDEHIIRDMIHRLKRQKKLTSKALQALLVPTLTKLDLEGIFLTNKILCAVWTQCPNVVAVSLKGCGYIITDTVLNKFTQNLPKLQRLNLCSCTHLTSKCLSVLSKNLPHLKVLHIGNVPHLTFSAAYDFMKSAKELAFLDIYYLKTSSDEFAFLTEFAKQRGKELILKEPRKKMEMGESVRQEETEPGNSSELWGSDTGDVI
ncbi:hypothetical protein Btru_001398 [Bulinus truncatus]|nr:hypothetical protein Btru_001398 [Bulinus truncatus]